MKAYVITPISNFLNFPRVREFHATMFHGVAERNGKYLPDIVHFVNANSPNPPILNIARTIYRMPDISQPGTNLVVSKPFAASLQRLPGLRIEPVAFSRLVNVEYNPGDNSWFERWGTVDPRHLLRTLPDVPEAHEGVGDYFEVQCWRWCDIAQNYPDAGEVRIEVGTPPMSDEMSFSLSEAMLNEHPLLKHGDLLLGERAFEILEPGFDWEFFIARKYNVPGTD